MWSAVTVSKEEGNVEHLWRIFGIRMKNMVPRNAHPKQHIQFHIEILHSICIAWAQVHRTKFQWHFYQPACNYNCFPSKLQIPFNCCPQFILFHTLNWFPASKHAKYSTLKGRICSNSMMEVKYFSRPTLGLVNHSEEIKTNHITYVIIQMNDWRPALAAICAIFISR